MIETAEKIDERSKEGSYFSLANHLKQFNDLGRFSSFYPDAKSLLRDMEYLESTIHQSVALLLDMEKKDSEEEVSSLDQFIKWCRS